MLLSCHPQSRLHKQFSAISQGDKLKHNVQHSKVRPVPCRSMWLGETNFGLQYRGAGQHVLGPVDFPYRGAK